MQPFFIYNGRFFKNETGTISINNRSFRYGDGFFETMRVKDAAIKLWSLHEERMYASLILLKMDLKEDKDLYKLKQQIFQLCIRNNCYKSAKVRITFFREGDELIQENFSKVSYVIQAWPINILTDEWNANGLITGIYPDMRKSLDYFSNLKSNNFLPYVMGVIYAKQNKWNDSIVLNSKGRITDSCIANVFIIKDNIIYTPPLSEGCVAGVMRKNLLELFSINKIKFKEKPLAISEIMEADEMFLTNAVKGIKWVRNFEKTAYKNKQTKEIAALLSK